MMITRAAISSLLIATTMIASAEGRAQPVYPAAEQARLADDALAEGRSEDAIVAGERAVATSPHDAGYRSLLGRAYLKAGRFGAAEVMLAEALRLDRGDGRAAGGLVLAQLAQRRPGAARASLIDHGRNMPQADLGLLAALAGEMASGTAILEHCVRTPNASLRARQNLALVYALANRWRESRMVAAIDLGEAGAEARMLLWSARSAGGMAAHIAALVGAPATNDPGRPTSLALRQEPAVAALAHAEAQISPVQFAGLPGIQFAPRREIVQPIPPAHRPAAAPRIMPGRSSSIVQPSGEDAYVVQIGAYGSAALAEAGWRQAQRRLRALDGRQPLAAVAMLKGSPFYRVAVGGFARRDQASGLCMRIRREGGACFVRPASHERALESAFTPPNVNLASR